MQAKITIIGRPNVGKSSFFNMYIGHKIAIVADEAGTTRDISEFNYHDKENDISYIISDSGGLDFSSSEDEIAQDIIWRTEQAMEESDLLFFIIEYDRITELDQKILQILKQKGKENVFVIANKADNEDKEMEAYSQAGIGGFTQFFPVSVSHNKGVKEIKKAVAKYLKELDLGGLDFEEDTGIKLAIVGRPNVGKSSIINALTGKQRVMVKDMSGTTRDSIDTKMEFEGLDFTLIDTAGIRRLSKIGTRNIENWSVMRTERSIKRADIVAVIIDGFDGIAQQDLSIISRVLEEKKGLIIVVNKWDKVLEKPGIEKEKIMERYLAYLKEKMDFLPWVSVIFTSAVEKKRIGEVLKAAKEIYAERQKRLKTGMFNNFLEEVLYKHPPTGTKKSHKPKIYYGSQVDVNPPKFVFSVSNPEHFHFTYKRYLENRIRETFGFFGTPMIIEFKGRGKTKDIVK